jgi:hypothetical protein
MRIYYMLHVTTPSFLFGIGITTTGRVISAVVLALLGFHRLLKPFFHYGLNGSRQISHLLVTPLLGEWLCITLSLRPATATGLPIPLYLQHSLVL